MKYRSEIDGLRALAVIPVILYHAGLDWFSGGYVGVDVFFVISGYLITTIILSELDGGKFRLSSFYERRVRRIFPALFFVVLCCSIVAFFVLPPFRLVEFSKSIIYVATFSSNIFFQSSANYFGMAGELSPMMHTWSLAVEEQYYIIFPILLVAVFKSKARALALIALIATISGLIYSESLVHLHDGSAFFFLQSRVWELAAGVLVSVLLFYYVDREAFCCKQGWLAQSLSTIGLCLILYSVFMFSLNTPFPGKGAVLPVLGTCLIIMFATNSGVVGKLLSLKPIVLVGLLSYSAYLWHQPLFVFLRYLRGGELAMIEALVVSALSLVLAYFTWRFVEKPFRNRQFLTQKKVFALGFVGSLFVVCVGVCGLYDQGWAKRMPDNIYKAVKGSRQKDLIEDSVLGLPMRHIASDDIYESGGSEKFVFLTGDSHAGSVAGSFEELLLNAGWGLRSASYAGCPPVFGARRSYYGDSYKCDNYLESIYQTIVSDKRVDTVVLLSRWSFYLEGARFDNEEGGVERGFTGSVYFVDRENGVESKTIATEREVGGAYIGFITSLLDLGLRVVVVYPIPEVGWFPPDLIAQKYLFAEDDTAQEIPLEVGSISYDVFLRRNEVVKQALDSVGEHENLYRVYPEDVFCNSLLDGRCVVHDGYNIYYKDDDHLSGYGARLIFEKVMDHIGTKL